MMRTSRLTHSVGSVALLGVAIVLFLSGCGGTAQSVAFQPGATVPSVMGIALMTPQPSGSADLTWDPTNNDTLTVALSVTGLAPRNPSSYPSAPYPATLGMGSCKTQGAVTHQLTAVAADQFGAGASASTIRGVAGGIPAKDWYIALRSPAPADHGAVLACANVINPTPSTTQRQTVTARLHGMPHDMSDMGDDMGDDMMGGGAGAHGMARLELSGTTLTVTLYIAGLAPGSHHEAHIHTGSCARQGPVAHDLNEVVADADGHAQVKTTLQNVQSIPGNWYIHVHTGTNLRTQAGYQPIACGDVFTRS